MATIKIYCNCGAKSTVNRDIKAPDNAISMGCNWCPVCDSENDYTEWYNYSAAAVEKTGINNDQLELWNFTVPNDIKPHNPYLK